MLTPSFTITQTNEELLVNIRAPYTQLNDVEINALDCEFWFYSWPYFLRLTFPHSVVDDDEPPTSYNADNGEFEICLRKMEVGQHFPDLDLLSNLLAPRKRLQNIKANIEVLKGEDEDLEEEEDDEDEWLIDQEPSPPEPDGILNSPKYGFGNLTQGVFNRVKSEFGEIVDLPEPDITPSTEREKLRKLEENCKFCCDHYLADFMERQVLEEPLAFNPIWLRHSSEKVLLSDKDKESLKKLGNKEFLLTKTDKLNVWLSLVDIIFAYAYNHRTTLGEDSVESAWTINKLSATLSWLATFNDVNEVSISCFRRMLTYGLYRNWELAQIVFNDTIAILKLGRRQVLKCLLEINSLFNLSEPRFLLNQLYIHDYCIWIQKVSEHKLNKLTEKLEQVNISKCDVGFDLEELEQAALLVQQEEETLALTEKVKKIKFNDQDCISSSGTSSSSEDSESSSSEDTTDLDSDDDSSPETLT